MRCAPRQIALMVLTAVTALITTLGCATADDTGTISGSVQIGKERPADFAIVFLMGTKMVAMVREGRFVIREVPPGMYRAGVRFVGYLPRSSAVAVRAGETTAVDFVLRAGVPLETEIRASAKRSFFAEDSVAIALECGNDVAAHDCVLVVRNSSTMRIRFPKNLSPYVVLQYQWPTPAQELDADEYAIRREFRGEERDTVLLGPNQVHRQRMRFKAYEPAGACRFRLTLCAPRSEYTDMFQKWQTTAWYNTHGTHEAN